jgi:hypothetical protein
VEGRELSTPTAYRSRTWNGAEDGGGDGVEGDTGFAVGLAIGLAALGLALGLAGFGW